MVRLENLQAALARRSDKPLFAVLLLRVDDGAAAREFLRGLLPRVARGDATETAGTPLVNVFFSWSALSTILARHPHLDADSGRRQFEPFFTDPMQAPDSLAMSGQLGFSGPSAPEHWWAGFATRDIGIAVYLGCDDEEQRHTLLEELRGAASGAGLSELNLPSFPGGAVNGYRPAGGRLHFGYRDGITAPDVDWEDLGRVGATNLREFVLGYPTEQYPTAPYPEGPWRDFATDGSFACFTWIHQDVAGFEAFLSRHAPDLAPEEAGVDPKEWLAAKLLGRWRDGTPLARHADVPPVTPDLDDGFGYAADPTGIRCPLDAHIRVAYSRDQPLSFANARRFPNGPPRLIRRGFSYGEPLATPEDDGKDRGLFGMFLCARVNEQFYTVLRWMQQTDFSDLFERAGPGRSGQDRLTGSRLPGGGNDAPDLDISGAGSGNPRAVSLQPFIRYRGVAVMFVPSIAALRVLAS